PRCVQYSQEFATSSKKKCASYGSAMQAARNHLQVCLKLLGILHRSGDKATAVSKGDQLYLATVMLNASLLKALHVADSFQMHCHREFPRAVANAEEEDEAEAIFEVELLGENFHPWTQEADRGEAERRDGMVSCQTYRRLQAECVVLSEASRGLEQERETDEVRLQQAEEECRKLRSALARRQPGMLAEASRLPASMRSAEVMELQGFGVKAESLAGGGSFIAESELQRLKLEVESLRTEVKEARAAAEDAVPLATSARRRAAEAAEQRARAYMQAVCQAGGNYGLQFNWGKLELMPVCCDADISNGRGEVIKKKRSIVYLGSLLSADGRPGPEVQIIIGAAKYGLETLSRVWSHTRIDIGKKFRILDACVISKLFYCLHTVWSNANEVRRLDRFYVKCLRKILHIPHSFISRVSNQSVLETAGKTALSATLRQRQNGLMAKIAKLPHDSIVRRSVFVDGTFAIKQAPGGRPRCQHSRVPDLRSAVSCLVAQSGRRSVSDQGEPGTLCQSSDGDVMHSEPQQRSPVRLCWAQGAEDLDSSRSVERTFSRSPFAAEMTLGDAQKIFDAGLASWRSLADGSPRCDPQGDNAFRGGRSCYVESPNFNALCTFDRPYVVSSAVPQYQVSAERRAYGAAVLEEAQVTKAALRAAKHPGDAQALGKLVSLLGASGPGGASPPGPPGGAVSSGHPGGAASSSGARSLLRPSASTGGLPSMPPSLGDLSPQSYSLQQQRPMSPFAAPALRFERLSPQQAQGPGVQFESPGVRARPVSAVPLWATARTTWPTPEQRQILLANSCGPQGLKVQLRSQKYGFACKKRQLVWTSGTGSSNVGGGAGFARCRRLRCLVTAHEPPASAAPAAAEEEAPAPEGAVIAGDEENADGEAEKAEATETAKKEEEVPDEQKASQGLVSGSLKPSYTLHFRNLKTEEVDLDELKMRLARFGEVVSVEQEGELVVAKFSRTNEAYEAHKKLTITNPFGADVVIEFGPQDSSHYNRGKRQGRGRPEPDGSGPGNNKGRGMRAYTGGSKEEDNKVEPKRKAEDDEVEVPGAKRLKKDGPADAAGSLTAPTKAVSRWGDSLTFEEQLEDFMKMPRRGMYNRYLVLGKLPPELRTGENIWRLMQPVQRDIIQNVMEVVIDLGMVLNLLIETMQACHRHTESVLSLVNKVCGKMSLSDISTECEQVRAVLKDTDSMFATLRDASTADLSQVLQDVKKYASDVVEAESRELQSSSKKRAEATEADVNDRFKKLEARVLSELGGTSASGIASGGDGDSDSRSRAKQGDSQLLKKMTNRMSDFEAQVAAQLQNLSGDIDKKISFMGSQRGSGGGADAGAPGLESLAHDLDAVKYEMGELKDVLSGAKNDTSHVKRIVLACERDMEDFTAAMDAVNVDLDEMRARVDSTHSIITSRQRVEATVTAEISTMRLDMGDMQEALKAHDAWMEDVSQSLQECHERCGQLGEDIVEHSQQSQAKLDAKTDITSWSDMNDDIDASVKTVRDMASALRLEVDSRRRKVDEAIGAMHEELKSLDEKVDTNGANIQRYTDSNHASVIQQLEERVQHSRDLESSLDRHSGVHADMHGKVENLKAEQETRISKLEAVLQKQDEELHKEANDRMDGMERHHANLSKENAKRLNALDLRISGLQGASGESKRDIGKLRDEVNSLTVKSAAHDVDIGKNSDDCRKLERQRAEDNQRSKQDMDALYEELDQKVYEKNFQGLEDNVTKLTRGTVKLCQVVGVFPGARMNDGTEEELDVDVELLNWEDCAQNLTQRVEKTWRQLSSQKYRSILDLVSKKADHSVLRLLQISQQHIESQLDRVRHERELWKEVVDKRAQQPLQLALSLKDPHTGMPIGGPPGYGQQQQQFGQGGGGGGGGMQYTPRQMIQGSPGEPMMQTQPMGGMGGGMGAPLGEAPKGSPLAKRIARPPQGAPPPQSK
ncbi:unnamed protein product, partial [Polarella glacialis]